MITHMKEVWEGKGILINHTVETFHEEDLWKAGNAFFILDVTRKTSTVINYGENEGRIVNIDVDVKVDVEGERFFFSITPTLIGWDEKTLWNVLGMTRNGRKKPVKGMEHLVQYVIELLKDADFIARMMGNQVVDLEAEIADLEARIATLKADKAAFLNGESLDARFVKPDTNNNE
jgi:hypothetical protein